MSAVLIASISELCSADHRNEARRIASWTANKSPHRIGLMLNDPGLWMLVAERDGAIAAVGAVRADEIALNYVTPWARYSGVSKALLRAMEAQMAENGVTQARLTSTHTARRFYLAMGWSVDDAVVPCETGTGLAMHKWL